MAGARVIRESTACTYLLFFNECPSIAFPSGPRRPSDAMHVLANVDRSIVADHVCHMRYVDTSRDQIRAYEPGVRGEGSVTTPEKIRMANEYVHSNLALLEPPQYAFPLSRTEIAGIRLGDNPARFRTINFHRSPFTAPKGLFEGVDNLDKPSCALRTLREYQCSSFRTFSCSRRHANSSRMNERE